MDYLSGSEETYAHGCLVLDLDGTLAKREQQISDEAVCLLYDLEQVGWHLVILTGRPIDNIKTRVLAPVHEQVRRSRLHRFPRFMFYTCEGAHRWVFEGGRLREDQDGRQDPSLLQSRQHQIEAIVIEELASNPYVGAGQVAVRQAPDWWENVMLIIKLQGEMTLRAQLAAVIEQKLNTLLAPEQLRVGVAGETSLAITRAGIHKASALHEIVRAGFARGCTVYIADEFVPPGNDAIANSVPGVVKVSVDRSPKGLAADVFYAGAGPMAALAWLSVLYRKSVLGGYTPHELVEMTNLAFASVAAPGGR